MPPIALALLLTSAAIHAGWNLLVKGAREKQVFAWLAMIAGSVCFAPFLLLDASFSARVWPYVIFSALAEIAYFIALTYAYDKSDFSLVYPIARGGAPALLALWAALFLGDRLSATGLLGLAVLLLGLMVVGGAAWWARHAGVTPGLGGVGAAVGVACFISIYSVIDGAAVRLTDPAPYTTLVLSIAAVLLTPAILARYGQRAVLAEWRANRSRIILVGLASFGSYILVLWAYTIASVSYAGAIREISVVFGALAGWRWLGEGFGIPRTIGAILIFLGILVITIAG
jgi:drug/metabolite transporter (DMT)-like permease